MAWFKPRFKPSNPSCPVQFIPSVQPGRLLLLISKLQDGGGDEGSLLPQEWFQSPSRAGFWGGSAWVSAPGDCFCPCKSTTVFGSAGSVCSTGDGKQQRKLFKINLKKKKIQGFSSQVLFSWISCQDTQNVAVPGVQEPQHPEHGVASVSQSRGHSWTGGGDLGCEIPELGALPGTFGARGARLELRCQEPGQEKPRGARGCQGRVPVPRGLSCSCCSRLSPGLGQPWEEQEQRLLRRAQRHRWDTGRAQVPRLVCPHPGGSRAGAAPAPPSPEESGREITPVPGTALCPPALSLSAPNPRPGCSREGTERS